MPRRLRQANTESFFLTNLSGSSGQNLYRSASPPKAYAAEEYPPVMTHRNSAEEESAPSLSSTAERQQTSGDATKQRAPANRPTADPFRPRSLPSAGRQRPPPLPACMAARFLLYATPLLLATAAPSHGLTQGGVPSPRKWIFISSVLGY
jgi:hypothetical protein